MSHYHLDEPCPPDHIATQWCRLKGGGLLMGSPQDEQGRSSEEGPQHEVLLGDFMLMATPVSQRIWARVMGFNPSSTQGPLLPVDRVSWLDAVDFCVRLAERTGLPTAYRLGDVRRDAYGRLQQAAVHWSGVGFRLPTEAEWEYACRAGSAGPTYGPLDEIAWYRHDSGHEPHPVATRAANRHGLYDMLGNGFEWCWDWLGPYPEHQMVDPRGPEQGTRRVLRGCACGDSPWECRAARRHGDHPASRWISQGLRLACSGWVDGLHFG